MAKKIYKLTIPSVDRDVEQLEHSHTAMKCQYNLENCIENQSMLSIHILYDPAIPYLAMSSAVVCTQGFPCGPRVKNLPAV